MSDERHGEKRSVEAVVGKDDASTEGSSSNKRRKLWSSSVTIDKSIEQMSAVQKVVDDLLLSPVPALHKDNVIYQDRKEFEHQKKKKGFIPALCSLLRTSPEFRFRPRANSNTLGDFGITQMPEEKLRQQRLADVVSALANEITDLRRELYPLVAERRIRAARIIQKWWRRRAIMIMRQARKEYQSIAPAAKPNQIET